MHDELKHQEFCLFLIRLKRNLELNQKKTCQTERPGPFRCMGRGQSAEFATSGLFQNWLNTKKKRFIFDLLNSAKVIG